MSDLTYVATWRGFVYVAVVVDAFIRRIVGWRASSSVRSALALDALEQATWERQDASTDELIHHSDRGVQYLSIRYTERLAEAGIEPSVGSRGDGYDNALADTIIGLSKTEVIRRRGLALGAHDPSPLVLSGIKSAVRPSSARHRRALANCFSTALTLSRHARPTPFSRFPDA